MLSGIGNGSTIFLFDFFFLFDKIDQKKIFLFDKFSSKGFSQGTTFFLLVSLIQHVQDFVFMGLRMSFHVLQVLDPFVR